MPVVESCTGTLGPQVGRILRNRWRPGRLNDVGDLIDGMRPGIGNCEVESIGVALSGLQLKGMVSRAGPILKSLIGPQKGFPPGYRQLIADRLFADIETDRRGRPLLQCQHLHWRHVGSPVGRGQT